MKKYNPDIAPNPKAWLALDEDARQQLAVNAHLMAGLDMTQLILHSVTHVIVENQLAMNIDFVCRNFNRLKREGLGRHDAIHACGSVLMGMLYDQANGNSSEQPNDAYAEQLNELTAKKWLAQDY